jgi:ribosomal protein L16/L10AE
LSPTIFTVKGYRFLFFSREEARMHVHVQSARGEAKFWMEPQVVLAKSTGLSARELRAVREIIEERSDEITRAWYRHFSG